ncbi:MAG: FtsK/SpoIIIE domain-containing protein [Actinomycetes bacterium]
MSSAGAVFQLPLRLDDGTGNFLDLMIELASAARIGELADHLAELLGSSPGQTISNSSSQHHTQTAYLRGDLIAECGPRAGDTIRLSSLTWLPENGQAEVARLPPQTLTLAPVFLRNVNDSQAPTLQLNYGVSQVRGALFEVSERVEVRSTGATIPAVNGTLILGSSRLRTGDLLKINDQLSLVQIKGSLRPPERPGPTQTHKLSSSHHALHSPVTITLPTPPSLQRLPGFPVLSAIVPLLMGAALWVATKSLASALFVLFSFVFVVASGLEARRESRAEQAFRLAEFRSDLTEAVTRISELRQLEFKRLDQQVPAARRLVGILADRSEPLWSRSVNDAATMPMRVRLGTAQITPQDGLEVPTQGRADLREELSRLAEQYELAELPAIVDLDQTCGLGIVGRDELATSLARSLVLQLSIALTAQDLSIKVLASEDRLDIWRWCAWLPHCRVQGVSPRTLFVVDNAEDELVSAAIDRHGASTTRVLWLSALRAGLPSGLGAIVDLSQQPRLYLDAIPRDDPSLKNSESRRVVNLAIEDLTEDEAVPLARSLAPLIPERSAVELSNGSSARSESPAQRLLPTSHLPVQLRLQEVLAEEQMLLQPKAVLNQWERSAHSSGLGAPLGRVANGVLHLDLRADGPHALIAGTTGSGKSELLRSLVASLALHHSPDRLSFLLIDYKGGAAFRSLSSLPHTVGLITDLSPLLAKRALISLRAEVRYRESQLAQLGVADLAEAPLDSSAKVPPALVVVVDEFAALSRELPEFVDGLVDLSQRGRSLGMHLVLATQRPAGVITDAIRANTALRIALRVADEDDSRDVVELAQAALLPREVPGRAILRSGPGRCAAVQFAYSGTSESARPRVQSWPLGNPPPQIPPQVPGISHTELESAVSSARAAATLGKFATPRPPWLDALPMQVKLSQVLEAGQGLAIGWTDLPDQQRRSALELNLDRDGGVLVLGASGSGRTTTLKSCAQAAIIHYRGRVHLFGIDSGRGLRALRSFAQVGEVLPVDDVERVLRLLRRLAAHVQSQTQSSNGGSACTPRLLLLDGFGAFEEIYERLNRGEGLDLLTRIARDGRSVGTHLMLAAHRRSEVPPSISSLLGCQIYLRSSTVDEALMLGLDAESAAKEVPPGRGSHQGEAIQIAEPDDLSSQVAMQQPGHAESVGALPRLLRVTELFATDPSGLAPALIAPWTSIPCGIEAEQLSVAALDLAHHHGLIAGAPRSGKSTALNTLCLALRLRPAANIQTATYLLAAYGSDAHDPKHWDSGHWDSGHWDSALIEPNSAQDSVHLLQTAADAARSGACTLLAVDDICSLIELPGGEQIEAELLALVDLARTHSIRLLLSGDVDSLQRSYSDLIIQLRSARTGLLLSGDPDLHGSLFHTALPVRSELLHCAGRGWLIAPSTAQAVQIAHP